MPSTIGSLLSKLALWSAAGVGIYSVLLGCLMTPPIQRFALYANNINTLFLGDDRSTPEAFGFAKHQVTPFSIHTSDNETLFAWHILPVDVYARHENELRSEDRPHGPVEDITKTRAFQLLQSEDSSQARVVVTFHGNAGHIAQGWRPDTYRNLATLSNTHVLTIDYRGFGYSTGSPTEAGLITDGTALVDWVMRTAGTPPERIVILGQSLGTAVGSAVALHFADPSNELIPSRSRELHQLAAPQDSIEPITFAGVVLVAPFSSLPSLMLTYRIGGLLPILLPLRPFPALARMLTSRMVDKWLSAERLEAYYLALTGSSKLRSVIGASERSMGHLQLVHSTNDMDIPYHQTEMICRRIFGEGSEPGIYEDEDQVRPVKCIDGSNGSAVLDVKAKGKPRVRFDILEHGGHNRIITHSPVMAAVTRAFEDLFD